MLAVALRLMDQEKKKDPAAAAMARKRAASMTPERRSEIAAKAAGARWGKKKATKRGTAKTGKQ
jgi:hypothetical protein